MFQLLGINKKILLDRKIISFRKILFSKSFMGRKILDFATIFSQNHKNKFSSNLSLMVDHQYYIYIYIYIYIYKYYYINYIYI